ncbi:hypothetical protein GEMRC1_004328 [Eukaryota sp. GEM-RC1]
MTIAAGDSLYVDEDFSGAIDKYTDALNSLGPDPVLLSHRAAAHLRLSNYTSALDDCEASLRLSPQSAITHFRKGISLFMTNRYSEALRSFESAEDLSCPADVSSWKKRTKLFIQPPKEQSTPVEKEIQKSTQPETPPTVTPPKPAPSTPAILSEQHIYPSKIRYDWLQTTSHVSIEIFAPSIDRNLVHVTPSSSSVEITFPLPTGSDYMLDLELAGEIDPSDVSISTTKKKVEIKLKKANSQRWKVLERGQEATTVDPKMYPSSRGAKDWTKIAKEKYAEIEDEEKKNQDFLAQIFSQGDPDTQRAMQKSFLESGGTVLSTNWSEVGKKKVKRYGEDEDDK